MPAPARILTALRKSSRGLLSRLVASEWFRQGPDGDRISFGHACLRADRTGSRCIEAHRRWSGRAGGRAPILSIGLLVCLYVTSQWLSRSVGEIRGLIYARAERRMSRTLSERLFAHILRLPLRFHLNRQTGALTQSLTNGLQGYQTVLHTLVFSILPVAAELGTVVAVLAKLGQPTFLKMFCGAIVCYVIVFSYAARRTKKAARSASAAQVESIGNHDGWHPELRDHQNTSPRSR